MPYDYYCDNDGLRKTAALRLATQAPWQDCRQSLISASGNYEAAKRILIKQGTQRAIARFGGGDYDYGRSLPFELPGEPDSPKSLPE
jgi:hypothetical protein